MRAPLIVLVAAAGFGTAVVAPGWSHPGHPDPAVSISGFAFSPSTAQAVSGDTVRWTWSGPDTNHSVTSTAQSGQAFESDPGDDSPSHPVGDVYTVRFDTPGTYPYFCRVHPGMQGSVVVSAAPADGGGTTTTGETTTTGITTTTTGGTTTTTTTAPPVGGQGVVVPAADVVRPAVTSLRFTRGAVRFRLSEKSRVVLRLFRPSNSGRATGRALLTVRRSLGAGTAAIRVRTKRRGRFVARVVATDAAGNATTRTLRLRLRG